MGRVGDITSYNITSWEDCYIKCKTRSGCKYWIWTNSQSGVWANQCITLLDATSKMNLDDNCVSGSRNCVRSVSGTE